MLFELKDIEKTYGKGENRFDALKGISLTIKEGESLAIVGKSGSGKSTLMHIMASLDRPSKGSVTYQGKDLAKLPERQIDKLRNKEFGFVFQQFFLKPDETVLENVALPLKIAGVTKRHRTDKSMKVLEQVGLADKAANRATDLSGGQKQRVCIARALVTRPKVIFADEPTGNLDSESGKQVMDLLFDLQKSETISLVIVTHDHELAARCKRQIKLSDGRIEGKA